MPQSERHERPSSSPLLALVLVSFALLLFVAFQTVDLVRARTALTAVRYSQERSVQQALKLRQQLESIAGQTAQLAADGDSAARAVVVAMRKEGVTLTPPKKSELPQPASEGQRGHGK